MFHIYHNASACLPICNDIAFIQKSAATEATAPKIVSLDCCDTTHPMTGMKETDVFAKHRNCHRYYSVVSHLYYNSKIYYLSNNLL